MKSRFVSFLVLICAVLIFAGLAHASEGSPMPVCQPGHNCPDQVAARVVVVDLPIVSGKGGPTRHQPPSPTKPISPDPIVSGKG